MLRAISCPEIFWFGCIDFKLQQKLDDIDTSFHATSFSHHFQSQLFLFRIMKRRTESGVLTDNSKVSGLVTDDCLTEDGLTSNNSKIRNMAQATDLEVSVTVAGLVHWHSGPGRRYLTPSRPGPGTLGLASTGNSKSDRLAYRVP